MYQQLFRLFNMMCAFRELTLKPGIYFPISRRAMGVKRESEQLFNIKRWPQSIQQLKQLQIRLCAKSSGGSIAVGSQWLLWHRGVLLINTLSARSPSPPEKSHSANRATGVKLLQEIHYNLCCYAALHQVLFLCYGCSVLSP